MSTSSVNRTKHLHVVCSADNNYSMPLATTICSILTNLASHCKLTVYVLDGGISPTNKQKIIQFSELEQCDIQWISLSKNTLGNLPTSGHISLATYYRLLITDLLPLAISKIIYLDCDLVVNTNLEKLWDIDIADYALLAVQDMGCPYVNSGMKFHRELGISGDRKYFNAGVLVINLEKWRVDNVAKTMIELVQHHSAYLPYYDQDALNVVFAEQWGELDPRWNQMTKVFNFSSWEKSPFDEETYKNVLYHPYILHFASEFKPWNTHTHRHKAVFYHYVDMTAWKGWRFPIWKSVWRKIQREFLKARAN